MTLTISTLVMRTRSPGAHTHWGFSFGASGVPEADIRCRAGISYLINRLGRTAQHHLSAIRLYTTGEVVEIDCEAERGDAQSFAEIELVRAGISQTAFQQ